MLSIDSFDYAGPALSWAIDGLAGYVMTHKEPFSATNHRGVLIPKRADINLDYVKAVVEPIFRELKKGRQGDNGENEYTSLPPYMIQEVQIPIPVDSDGNPSLSEQDRIAKQYETITDIKEEIKAKLDSIIQQKISFIQQKISL